MWWTEHMASRSNSPRISLASASIALFGFLASAAYAQQSPGGGASSSHLPPVVVDSPNSRRAASTPAKPAARAASSGASKRAQRAARTVAAPRRPTERSAQDVQPGQDPRGPINGYVADRSLTGTKTHTPLMETPQAISVIGREQIRDQNPNSFAEALRYAPGVRSETFGADTRNDWFKIRGFDAQDVGLFADGLQLSSFAFATWKFPPFGIERIDILRAPSAVLYGGSGPGGRECDQQEAAVRAAELCRSRRQFVWQQLFFVRFRRTRRDAIWSKPRTLLSPARHREGRRYPDRLHARQ
jgi:iron complex outermembrane recepter protein